MSLYFKLPHGNIIWKLFTSYDKQEESKDFGCQQFKNSQIQIGYPEGIKNFSKFSGIQGFQILFCVIKDIDCGEWIISIHFSQGILGIPGSDFYIFSNFECFSRA